MNYFATVMSFLQNREAFLADIDQGENLNSKIFGLLISSAIFLGIYGLIIGGYGGWLQAIVSAIKLPALYLLTLVICFPTLYFFNLMFGSKQRFNQYLALLLTAVAVMSILLFGFAPVAIFFLMSTKNYFFFLLLNVIIFSITGFLGISFFYKEMVRLIKKDEAGTKIRINILRYWLGLYAFVGTQLAWTLRPFFGSPDVPFALFRDKDSNFYLAILRSIAELLNF